MIRSSAWGLTATQVSLETVPAGTYEVYLTVWEDNTSATFDVRLEGSIVLSGFRSGSAGSWSRLGPWLTTVSDGSIDVPTAGPERECFRDRGLAVRLQSHFQHPDRCVDGARIRRNVSVRCHGCSSRVRL